MPARLRRYRSWGGYLAGAPDEVVVYDHLVVEEGRSTLLARIQADIRADRAPAGVPLPGAGDERVLLDPDDRSLQVHACHGRARQVEVVRDAILHLLADDPTLEPRDILVMCPDIEVFAPLIHATFGTAAGGEEADALPAGAKRIDLHVRLADRSLRQTNPVLGVVAQLLDLAGGRLAASQVLDLAGRAPVRRRFHLPHGGIFGRISESGCGAGRSCARCTCASSPWPLCGAPCSRAAA